MLQKSKTEEHKPTKQEILKDQQSCVEEKHLTFRTERSSLLDSIIKSSGAYKEQVVSPSLIKQTIDNQHQKRFSSSFLFSLLKIKVTNQTID